MALNWIHVDEFPFNSFLLMERFQIRLLFTNHAEDAEWKRNMSVALRHNPAVAWYLSRRCPECAAAIGRIAAGAPDITDAGEVRKAEIFALASAEDFVTYTRPEIMDASCDFIYAWDKARLFELADFSGKVVLDVGSGSGRLAFAAAERAKAVYASEPVDTLREYLRDKIAREGIRNIRVVDGMAHSLAYPDDTFDIVVSGHVVGDDTENELAELARVVRSGGWILDCPGEGADRYEPGDDMERLGFERLHYVGPLGGDVYRYRKRIFK